jgi:hypothetical protein
MNYVYDTRPPSTSPWPWIIMCLFMLLALYCGTAVLDAQAEEQAKTLAEKRAAQRKARQHATHVDQIAAEVCRDSPSPEATHYWHTSSELVCAGTRAALDTAVQAVAAVQQASRGAQRQ